jgi:hypothetical protein
VRFRKTRTQEREYFLTSLYVFLTRVAADSGVSVRLKAIKDEHLSASVNKVLKGVSSSSPANQDAQEEDESSASEDPLTDDEAGEQPTEPAVGTSEREEQGQQEQAEHDEAGIVASASSSTPGLELQLSRLKSVDLNVCTDGDLNSLEKARNAFYQSLVTLQPGQEVAGISSNAKFSSADATAITDFFFSKTFCQAAIARLLSIQKHYAKSEAMAPSTQGVMRARHAAQDPSLPSSVRQFFSVVAESQAPNPKRSEFHSLDIIRSRIEVLKKYTQLTKDIRDPENKHNPEDMDDPEESLLKHVERKTGRCLARGISRQTLLLEYIANVLFPVHQEAVTAPALEGNRIESLDTADDMEGSSDEDDESIAASQDDDVVGAVPVANATAATGQRGEKRKKRKKTDPRHRKVSNMVQVAFATSALADTFGNGILTILPIGAMWQYVSPSPRSHVYSPSNRCDLVYTASSATSVQSPRSRYSGSI